MTTYTAHKMPGDKWAVRHPDGRYALFSTQEKAAYALWCLYMGRLHDWDLAWSELRPEELEEP